MKAFKSVLLTTHLILAMGKDCQTHTQVFPKFVVLSHLHIAHLHCR